MSESIRAVERALDVLLCFSRQTPELSMTQIAEQVGMNKSTVHRLLATLERQRFVQRDPATGLYRPGLRILQLAYLTLESNDLRRLAAPFLRRLWEQHRETVTLSILDQADVVYLDVLESSQRVKLAAAVGQHLPAFSTASGKAILMSLPEEEVRRILENGMQPYTPSTLRSPEAVFKNLRASHEQGFALSLEEYEDGISAVAVPILDPDGKPLAAIAVAGPAYRLPRARMDQIGPQILEVARDFSQELAMTAHPRQ